jgi:predicted nuclease of predicted toxin-antitoxin system
LRLGRILVTLDKDFGELAIVRGLPHAAILRLVGMSSLLQADVTLRVIEAHGADPAAGASITAEAGRLRVRLPGDGGDAVSQAPGPVARADWH